LRRLAEAIERQTQATMAPGRRGNRQIGKRAIEFSGAAQRRVNR